MGAGCSGGSQVENASAPDVQLPAAQAERKERKKRIAEYRECVFAESQFEMKQEEAWSDAGLQAVATFCEDLPIGVVMYTEGGVIGFINYQTLQLSGHSRDTIQLGNHLSKLITTTEEIELDQLCYKEVYSAKLLCRSGETIPVSLYTIALSVNPDMSGRQPLKRKAASADDIFTACPPSPCRVVTREGLGVRNVSGGSDDMDAPLVMVTFISAHSDDKRSTFHMIDITKTLEQKLGCGTILEKEVDIKLEDEMSSRSSRGLSVHSSPQSSPADTLLAPRMQPLRRLTLHTREAPRARHSSGGSQSCSRGGSPRTSLSGKDAVVTAASYGDMIITIDYNVGTFLSATPAALLLFGSEQSNLIGKQYTDHLHACECTGDQDTLTKLARADIAYPIDQRLYVIVDPTTKEAGVVNVTTVTQIPGTTTAVIRFTSGEGKKGGRASAIRFQRFTGLPDELGTMIDSLSDATLVTTISGTIVHHNHMFGLLFECEVDEVVGKDVSIFVPHALQRPHTEYVKRFSSSTNKGIRKSLRRHRGVVGWTMREQPIPLDITISEISFSVDKVYYITTVRRLLSHEILSRYHAGVHGTMAALGLTSDFASPFEGSTNSLPSTANNTPQGTPTQLPLASVAVPALQGMDYELKMPTVKSPLKVTVKHPEVELPSDPVKDELRQLAEEVGCKLSDGTASPMPVKSITSSPNLPPTPKKLPPLRDPPSPNNVTLHLRGLH